MSLNRQIRSRISAMLVRGFSATRTVKHFVAYTITRRSRTVTMALKGASGMTLSVSVFARALSRIKIIQKYNLHSLQTAVLLDRTSAFADSSARRGVRKKMRFPNPSFAKPLFAKPLLAAIFVFAVSALLTQSLFAEDAAPASGITRAELPQDLSVWAMFAHADTIVKAVMLGLAFASLVTWTVWIAKSLELRRARAILRHGLRALGESARFAQARERLADDDGPVAQLIRTADAEIGYSAGLRNDGIKERIALQLERIEAAAGRKISRGTGVLATIGATAPFVGLFGTVWGIMNSFIGISESHTTNLAVVAPGIAEALLATAFGLVAAIPAVVIYNHLARVISGYRTLLGDASAQLLLVISRGHLRHAPALSDAAE